MAPASAAEVASSAIILVSSIAASSTIATMSRRPGGAAIGERKEFGMNRCGMAETVRLHVFLDDVRRRQPDHAITGLFVGFADRLDRETLAGSGLAVDQSQALGAGRPQERIQLFRGHAAVFVAGFDPGLVVLAAPCGWRPQAFSAA